MWIYAGWKRNSEFEMEIIYHISSHSQLKKQSMILHSNFMNSIMTPANKRVPPLHQVNSKMQAQPFPSSLQVACSARCTHDTLLYSTIHQFKVMLHYWHYQKELSDHCHFAILATPISQNCFISLLGYGNLLSTTLHLQRAFSVCWPLLKVLLYSHIQVAYPLRAILHCENHGS